MSVFKAYMKIAKKNIGMILLYLVIFFTVTIMFQRFAGEGTQGYTAESIPVGIIDEDGGTAAESLIDHIGKTNDVILLENDTESLQEELFYRNVDYIIRIPEGFMEKCIRGDERLKVTAVPGTYTGYYAEQQISNFINFARSYAAAGCDCSHRRQNHCKFRGIFYGASADGGRRPGKYSDHAPGPKRVQGNEFQHCTGNSRIEKGEGLWAL